VFPRVSQFVGITASGAVAIAAISTSTVKLRAQGLTGAGSTFAAPIYQKWADMYAAKTGVKVNYQGIGSGGGIKQLSDEIVDFGGSDGPMSDQQIAAAKGGPILHFPTVLGGVSITYNLPEIKRPLRLTGPVIASIYMGKIAKWNDSQIASLNPGVKLPDMDIAVTHRTEGSGTTYIFTDYLTAVSPEWAKGPGRAQIVDWPVGLGGKGSDGVAGLVKQTPGAIGYIELNYATHNGLPSALIRNQSGAWVSPTLASVTAAASGAVAKLPANSDYRISIVNPPGRDAYPISSFTWMLVYAHPRDAAKSKQLTDFMRWTYENGESVAGSLDYAPLPSSMIKRLIERLAEIRAAAN